MCGGDDVAQTATRALAPAPGALWGESVGRRLLVATILLSQGRAAALPEPGLRLATSAAGNPGVTLGEALRPPWVTLV